MGTKHKLKRGEEVTLEFLLESSVEDANGCFVWQKFLSNWGYGRQSFILNGVRKTHSIHRLVCTLVHGEPTEGQVAIHSCDNRACINPAHLRWGDQKENMRDAINKGRRCKSYTRLSKDVVVEIFLSALTITELVKIHNSTRSTISAIKNRRSWAHVTDNLTKG